MKLIIVSNFVTSSKLTFILKKSLLGMPSLPEAKYSYEIFCIDLISVGCPLRNLSLTENSKVPFIEKNETNQWAI